MSANSKNKTAKYPKWASKIEVSKSVKSHSNDPFFIKKAEESKKFLDKYGFPEWPKDKK